MSRQDRVPGGGDNTQLGPHMCFSLVGFPLLMSEHQTPYTSEVRHPRPRRQVPAGWLSDRWPERHQEAGACSGEEAVAHPIRAGFIAYKGPPVATSRTSQPLPDYPLPSPTKEGQGHPKPGSLLSRGRCLDISRGLGGSFSKGRQKPGAVFVPEGSQLFEATGHRVLGPSLAAHHLGP